MGVKSKADSGPVVLNLSKELTREIFEEFPVVQDAYARHVPGVSLRSHPPLLSAVHHAVLLVLLSRVPLRCC